MKRLFTSAIVLAVLFVLAVSTAGSYLSKPAMQTIGDAPLPFGAVNIEYQGVHGWFASAQNNQRCALLMHGVRGNRQAMLKRAEMLKANGYAVFLIDLQAHGETPGDFISFGYLESNSARKAVTFLRAVKHCQQVVSIGVSLGGAASVLGDAPLDVDAMVLEAVYSNIQTAVANRITMRLGRVGSAIAPLLYHQLPLRYGIALDSLSPIDAIQNVTAPVLVIAGADDTHTTLAESKAIFANGPTPKQFWQVDGAAHIDFYGYAPSEYTDVVLGFLAEHLPALQTAEALQTPPQPSP